MSSRKIMWKPSTYRKNSSSMTLFIEWLIEERGHKFADFHELQEWSVNDLEAFWKSIWDYFGLMSSNPFSKVLDKEKLPDALRFRGANVNIVHEIVKNLEKKKEKTPGAFRSETIGDGVLTWK